MRGDTDEEQTILKKLWNGGFLQLNRRRQRSHAAPSLNETCCGRWLGACCRAHPPVCRCCNPCPKSRGRTEQSARPRIRASHFLFGCSPTPAVTGKTGLAMSEFGLWN